MPGRRETGGLKGLPLTAGAVRISLPSCPQSQAWWRRDGPWSSALLPFAFQPPTPRGQSCFDFFSSLAFGLSRDGLAAPVG